MVVLSDWCWYLAFLLIARGLGTCIMLPEIDPERACIDPEQFNGPVGTAGCRTAAGIGSFTHFTEASNLGGVWRELRYGAPPMMLQPHLKNIAMLL